MPILTINGWTVPLEDKDQGGGLEEIGERGRAEDATLGISRIALKDALDLESSWLRREAAAALRELLLGRGHRWGFENNGSVTGDIANALYSSQKLGPASSTGAVLRVSEVIAEAVGTEYDSDKFGICALAAEAAATNMYSSNVATGTDTGGNTTGFTAVDAATLSSDATQFRQGAKSLKTVTNGAGGVRGGVKTDAVATVASTQYRASVYLRANSGTPDVRVYLRDEVNATSGTTKTVRLSTTQWKRVEVTHTMGGGSPTASLYIEEDTIDSSLTFFADQFQLQTGDYATTWADGAKSATNLKYYQGGIRKHDDLTVMFWTRGPKNSNSAAGYFFVFGDGTNHLRFQLSGDPIVTAKVSGTDQSGLTASNSALTAAGAWTHVAVVMRRNPQTGSAKLELYWNGTKDSATGSPASLPDFTPTSTFPHLWVGSDENGTTHLNGLIDELVVVPWGMTSDQISAWYNAAFSDLPKLSVAGDLLGTLDMVGAAPRRTIGRGYPPGSTALEVIERVGFRLEEI